MRSLYSFEGIEAVDTRFRRHQFSPHRHDAYVVGVTLKGVQQFRYRGEVRSSLPGEAFVLHPDEVHDGRSGTRGGYGYRAVYIPPALVTEALGGEALPFIESAVCRDPALINSIGALIPDQAEAHDDIARVSAITALADALAALGTKPARASHCTDYAAVKRIKDHLEASAPTGVSNADLEAEHGVDRYSLARRFRHYFGVSPHRFVILRRLDLAKSFIRGGASLVEAADASGFADQSHMTRHFRGAFGVSPGEWRRLQE